MNNLSVSEKKQLQLPRNFLRVLIPLILLLGVCILASLAFGSRIVGWADLMDGLFHPEVLTHEANVVRQRIVRTIFCLMCGAALGVSGALMQSVTRNPIADPSILGVNTGASLFVVCGIAFFNISSANEYIWLAIAGAILTSIFVFGIGSMGSGGATPLKLVLAGAATSAILSSLVVAVMIPRSNVMDQFRFWQVGSVGSGNWDSIATFVPFLIIGLLIAVFTGPGLNALALGDEVAKGLGVRTGTIRLVAALGAVLLCGAATALAGPIGFIGLLATHVIRLLIGPDLRYIIPMSALTGAIILTVSDVLGRLLGSPGELEVGIVTAFVGAPILILITMKAKMRAL
ncbi:FecCD family ABC transporter permease [Ureibacillus sinduriensis]|uniref:Iron ABC transporter n=1 Tax=Ureibacillus sinduriensis BLB-1 = JCM 15800 TaxID=1384057 RepID=A0A0A3HRF4_9BACL|nr:iron ABC transporter permease [Ureibacillus sinduriensis]KGR75191.1 iron ABC transporter [Ureibacillus sinduriensis BLB-1 = JCM 15800]